MNKTIARQLKTLPLLPGVYQFFNVDKKLLYVGKAKNLRTRVQSYFRPQANLSPAKQIMVHEVASLQTTTVTNETEALLLEGNLIKQHQTPYNVVLKDDKSWLYFAIDYREPFPRVSLERHPNFKGIKYFGPYPSAATARNSLTMLKKMLGLKTCTNPPDQPCFQAKLGRCLGHNTGADSKKLYHSQLKKLEQVLRGEVRELITKLKIDMTEAAIKKQYERAARLRDQSRALEQLAIKQNAISMRHENFDVFGLARGNDTACVSRFPVRRGVLLSADYFLVDHTKGLNDVEVLQGFLEQYLPQATENQKNNIVGFAGLPSTINKSKLSLTKRGSKSKLIKLAKAGAANYLQQSVASWESKEVRAIKGLTELKKIFNLPTIPKRIEGYDISNIQGTSAVGAMVVLTNGLPNNQQYRKFTIQSIKGPNDFAMLAQILIRRFTKNTDWPTPDLVMLDGGVGQLSTVKKVLDKIGIKIPIIALAKREETLYYYPNIISTRNQKSKTNQISPSTKLKNLHLPPNSPTLLMLEELRDEAHRFGITFYRSKHRKVAIKSAWDELPGIGPVLKKKLKAAFGSINALRQAPIEHLAKLLGSKRAEAIKKIL